jgi:hypothetical protein
MHRATKLLDCFAKKKKTKLSDFQVKQESSDFDFFFFLKKELGSGAVDAMVIQKNSSRK